MSTVSAKRRGLISCAVAILMAPRIAIAGDEKRGHRLAVFLVDREEIINQELEALARLGFVEGRNLEVRQLKGPSGGGIDARNARARELVAWSPDVILTGTTNNTRTAQRLTTTIPIVFTNVSDPVALGFVKSLAMPGGNLTGVSVRNLELWPKRLELIRELLPKAKRVALVMDSAFSRDGGYPQEFWQEMREAAEGLKLELIEADLAQSRGGFDEAFQQKIADSRVECAMLLGPWPSGRGPNDWADLQSRHHIPVLGFFPGRDEGDLLMVQMGTTLQERADVAARVIADIFRGAQPAETPVRQLTRVELVINMKVARELGIAIPKQILKRADRVIE